MNEELGINTEWIGRTRALMEQKDIKTYAELSDRSGLSIAALNTVLRGKHSPRQKTIEKVAKALDTTAKYLLFGDCGDIKTQIPVFIEGESIAEWVSGSPLDDRQFQWIQPFGVTTSSNAFALIFDKSDMKPAFYPGDLIIFETTNFGSVMAPGENLESYHRYNGDVYILAVEHGSKWIFGRLGKCNDGPLLEPVDGRFKSVIIEKHHQIVGIAVQKIQNFIAKSTF